MLSSAFWFCILAQTAEVRIPVDGERLYILSQALPTGASRKCPKYRWEYPFAAKAFAAAPGKTPKLKFRIYSQSQKNSPLMVSASRLLLRLWDLSRSKLQLDNPAAYDNIVDVFLADGGKAGGEQGIFEGPDDYGSLRLFNTIYIYHLEDSVEAVEMAREVAHEYGHAVLPPIGGFSSPENWGNGYLGEKLFLTWLAADLTKPKHSLAPEDIFGADQIAFGAWVQRFAWPLADGIWHNGPDMKTLTGKGQAAMDQYIGLILFANEAFPNSLHRVVKLSGGQDAQSALNGLVEAANEQDSWVIDIPRRIKGHVWLPLRGKWRISGGSIIARIGDWSELSSSSSHIRCHRI